MSQGIFSTEQLEAYRRDGYVLVPRLFDPEEIDLLRRAGKEDRAMDEHAFDRDDGEGGRVRLSLWNHPGDDLYGMFARSERIVDTVYDIEQSAHELIKQLNETVAENRPSVSGALEKVSPMLDEFAQVSQKLNGLTDTLDSILKNVDEISADASGVVEESGPEITELVRDLRNTVRNLNDLILILSEQPDSVIRGRTHGRRAGGAGRK